MKSNVDKCHSLVTTNNTVNRRVGNFYTKNSHCEKLLNLIWVIFDSNLTFNSHNSDLRKKPIKNVQALARVTPYMNISKRRIIMNAFLNHNSVTALLYEGTTIVLTIVK